MNISFRAGERGQAAVLVALALVALTGFAALAIDGGNVYNQRRIAQNAADAGAMAGAGYLIQTAAATESGLLAAIHIAVERDGIADTNGAPGDEVNANVTVYYLDENAATLAPGASAGVIAGPAPVGAIPAEARGVEVNARMDFPAHFAWIVGWPTLSASAKAGVVYIPPVECGEYAIFAGCTECDPNTLQNTGSGIHISGAGIHSNGDLHVTGGGETGIDITGGFAEYATDLTGADKITFVDPVEDPPLQQVAWVPFPELYAIQDWQPGSSYAEQAAAAGAYYQVNGDMDMNNPHVHPDGTMDAGVYYVSGNVDLHDVSGNVTLVAIGTIKVSGGVNIAAYESPSFRSGLLLYSGSSDDDNGAIQLSGSDNTWIGFIYARDGLVRMSSASNSTISGAIYSQEVGVSGSNVSVNFDSGLCPARLPKVVSVY